MTDKFTIRAAWIAASISIAVALGLGMRTNAALRERADRIGEYRKSSAKLTELESKAELTKAAVLVYEELGDPHPMPMAQLLGNALPQDKCETRELQSAPTIPGWTLRRVEVSFQSIELRKLAEFLAAAENCRPPWHIAELAVTALGENGSSGQVRLVAEALDKTK